MEGSFLAPTCTRAQTKTAPQLRQKSPLPLIVVPASVADGPRLASCAGPHRARRRAAGSRQRPAGPVSAGGPGGEAVARLLLLDSAARAPGDT